ncbi:hypothetical protein COO60DRAFT_1561460, partial [Scenedesmus sp. NREL 46B-D3]
MAGACSDATFRAQHLRCAGVWSLFWSHPRRLQPGSCRNRGGGRLTKARTHCTRHAVTAAPESMQGLTCPSSASQCSPGQHNAFHVHSTCGGARTSAGQPADRASMMLQFPTHASVDTSLHHANSTPCARSKKGETSAHVQLTQRPVNAACNMLAETQCSLQQVLAETQCSLQQVLAETQCSLQRVLAETPITARTRTPTPGRCAVTAWPASSAPQPTWP